MCLKTYTTVTISLFLTVKSTKREPERWSCPGSVDVDNGDAGASELHVFIAEVADVGNGGQILAYQLSQDA